jgi:ABC-type dipeptide/oligopeptide/nickel transport system ATPase component
MVSCHSGRKRATVSFRHSVNRVAILSDGRIVEFAETDLVFHAPNHPYTQKLIGALPALPRPRVVPVRRAMLTTVQGVA